MHTHTCTCPQVSGLRTARASGEHALAEGAWGSAKRAFLKLTGGGVSEDAEVRGRLMLRARLSVRVRLPKANGWRRE